MSIRFKKVTLILAILLLIISLTPQSLARSLSYLPNGLNYPFSDPQNWQIISGYNNGYMHGSNRGGYNNLYAYYGLDFAKTSGQTAGSTVYLPADAYYYRMQNSE